MIQIDSFGIIPLRKKEDKSWEVLLVLHKIGNHWGFPKGRAEKGETPFQAAGRELREETGLTVKELLCEEPFVEKYHFRNASDSVLKTVCYFAAEVEGDLCMQEEEIRDTRWAGLKEALSLLTFKEAQNLCRQVISKLDRLRN
ncbi:MAG: NUDIX domain-containing protein [Chlamydiales bacterium]|nr:NUDIX domain-containing protein [Chlamydiales bacterium]